MKGALTERLFFWIRCFFASVDLADVLDVGFSLSEWVESNNIKKSTNLFMNGISAEY